MLTIEHACTLLFQVDLPQFKPGDLVKISGDLEKVQRLQHGHGDWSDGVLLVRGWVLLHVHVHVLCKCVFMYTVHVNTCTALLLLCV